MLPIFLDFEASSLGKKSYPIEVAWSDPDGKIESHLINPYHVDDWEDWEPSAQQVHGLSRNYLSYHGKEPKPIAERMNNVLHDQTVYTNAPEFDSFWCMRLFDAMNMKPSFTFDHIETLLQEILPAEYWLTDKSGCTHIGHIYKKAREQCGLAAHRARNDVAYLIEAYKIALEININ